MQLLNLTKVFYKRLWFSVNDYFLTESVNLNADINYCIQCPTNIKGQLKEFYTLLINLELPVDSIWNDIYHRTQAEITSFTTNQVFKHRVLYNLSSDELRIFEHLFNRFANVKGIRPVEHFRLKAYNKSGILAVSYIKQDNEFRCINIYRLTKQRATNLYSFSVKSGNEAITPSHIGRAHRALHWLDVNEFKQAGVNFYDFCGWYNGTDDKDLLNINKFKEQFTSLKVKEYSGVIYKNKLLKFLKQIK